jgi:predicted nucleic acid-binding protein
MLESSMNIVIDTSILIAVIANEPQRDMIIEITRGADLLAPPSVHWEVGNAFSAMLRRNRITLAQTLRALEVYGQIPIRLANVELEDSLTIAAQLNIYAYDAYLIRCALKYNAPLISLDEGLVRAAQQMKVRIIEVER